MTTMMGQQQPNMMMAQPSMNLSMMVNSRTSSRRPSAGSLMGGQSNMMMMMGQQQPNMMMAQPSMNLSMMENSTSTAVIDDPLMAPMDFSKPTNVIATVASNLSTTSLSKRNCLCVHSSVRHTDKYRAKQPVSQASEASKEHIGLFLQSSTTVTTHEA